MTLPTIKIGIGGIYTEIPTGVPHFNSGYPVVAILSLFKPSLFAINFFSDFHYLLIKSI